MKNVELSLPGAQNSVMTAIIYFSEMLVASLLAILLLAISHIRMNLDAVLFLGGVVGWTLAEYFVHRFVLHGLAPIQHGLHHANPDEAVLTISWQIWVCFLLTYLVAGGTFVAGALIAYAWYLFVHHCSHHSPDSLSLTLIGHHRNHHRFATRNFGVSTTFWDHIFGTMLDGVPAKK
jgi:sterol desaturase/sphingolipid hydroxylase (fatty acid hydroxylase superfamily)